MAFSSTMNIDASVSAAWREYIRDFVYGLPTFGFGGLILGLLIVLVGPEWAQRLSLNDLVIDVAGLGSMLVIASLASIVSWALFVLMPYRVIGVIGERSFNWFRETAAGFACFAAGLGVVSGLHALVTGTGSGARLAMVLACWALMLLVLFLSIASMRGLKDQQNGRPRLAAWIVIIAVALTLSYFIVAAACGWLTLSR